MNLREIKTLSANADIEQELRSTFESLDADSLKKYAEQATATFNNAKTLLDDLILTVGRPKSPESLQMMKGYSQLILNVLSKEKDILWNLWREKRRT